MYKLILFTFCFFSITSCKLTTQSEKKHHKNNIQIKPEFFLIKEYRFSDGVVEFYVISNPPVINSHLKELIEAYNLETIPLDTLKKYQEYNRRFYRETQWLTRNYKEGEDYPEKEGAKRSSYYYFRQDLSYHHDDLIMVTMYSKANGKTYYEYCFNYKDYQKTNRNRIVVDLDSLYNSKKVE